MKLFLLLFLFFCSALFSNNVVLVTGGAGYIGSHACKALKEAGFLPVTYDSLAIGRKEMVKWGPLEVGDLHDESRLDEVFSKYKPCAVMHFAALRNVGESVKEPSDYYTNNVVGSIHLLNAMLKHDVKTIIFSSSCTVYGETNLIPIDENRPRQPTNPYAMSKYIVERAIEDFAHAYGFKYMLLRYFNAAGIDPSSGLKRSSHSQSFLIPKALLSLLDAKKPLMIFGTDYPTPDGTAIRDYIHVKDLARAHVLALMHLQEGKPSDALNLGTGRGYSVFEIVSAIGEVTQRQVPYVVKPRRDGDVSEAVADTRKAKAILNFETECSDIKNIIQTEWESMQ